MKQEAAQGRTVKSVEQDEIAQALLPLLRASGPPAKLRDGNGAKGGE